MMPGVAETTTERDALSWVDGLLDRIDALPGPSWAPYAITFVVYGMHHCIVAEKA